MYFSEFGAALCGDGPLCAGMARSCAVMALVLHTSGNRSPCADISSDVRGQCHLVRRWSDLCSDGLKSCGAGCSSQSYTYSFSIVNKQVKEMSQLGMKKRNPRRSTWVSTAGRLRKWEDTTSPRMTQQSLWIRSPLWIIPGISQSLTLMGQTRSKDLHRLPPHHPKRIQALKLRWWPCSPECIMSYPSWLKMLGRQTSVPLRRPTDWRM